MVDHACGAAIAHARELLFGGLVDGIDIAVDAAQQVNQHFALAFIEAG